MARKTKDELVRDIEAAGFKITMNRKQGSTDQERDGPLTLRWMTVLIPGKLWSTEDGDWCNKRKQRANETRILKLLREACGKAAAFDLCDHDMGHSSTGEAPDDAHCNFYVYTKD